MISKKHKRSLNDGSIWRPEEASGKHSDNAFAQSKLELKQFLRQKHRGWPFGAVTSPLTSSARPCWQRTNLINEGQAAPLSMSVLPTAPPGCWQKILALRVPAKFIWYPASRSAACCSESTKIIRLVCTQSISWIPRCCTRLFARKHAFKNDWKDLYGEAICLALKDVVATKISKQLLDVLGRRTLID